MAKKKVAKRSTKPRTKRKKRTLLEQVLSKFNGTISAKDKIRILQGDRIAVIAKVTPATAEFILDKANTHNRKFRPYLARDYAHALIDGTWDFNGEAIQFTPDGVSANGQHRLHAIKETKVTIPEQVIVFNIAPKGFWSIDNGGSRPMPERLIMEGYPWINRHLTSAMAILIDGPTATVSLRDDINKYIMCIKVYEEGLKFLKSFGRIQHVVSTVAAPIVRAYFNPDKISRERLREFVECLESGTSKIGPNSAAGHLRDHLMDIKAGRNDRATRTRLHDKTEGAIMAFAKQKELKQLRKAHRIYFMHPHGIQAEVNISG